MRKYVFLLILPFILLTTIATKFTVENSFPLFGKFIILDPGHGDDDPGSIYKDEYEKDYNLDFALVLGDVLQRKGATVILTREGDYDLSKPNTNHRKRSDFNNRIKLINDDKPDMYLSLHMNYLNDTKYFGGQAFYNDVNSKNELIAGYIQDELNQFYNFNKDYKKVGNDKYMYGKIDVPGILIEYGFMSSTKDRTNLKKSSYKIELSERIANGIIKYFT